MATKFPPMMRPVDTFIYKTKDSSPAICLISRGYTRKEQPQPVKEKKETWAPKATRFPKSLLGTLRTEVRSNSPPLISPEKRERVSPSTLRYPKAKDPLPGPLTALDQFTVQNGRIKRIPTSAFEFEIIDPEDEPITQYNTRINVKPDLKPILELNRRNQELQKRLRSLTISIETLSGPGGTQSHSIDPTRPKPLDTRHYDFTSRFRNATKGDFNLLVHNRQLLYNIRSAEAIPRKDAKWMKEIRQSPMKMNVKDWVQTDPVIMRRTITGGSMKRLYLSEGEEAKSYPRVSRTELNHGRLQRDSRITNTLKGAGSSQAVGGRASSTLGASQRTQSSSMSAGSYSTLY